jgi:hypothetical protein
MIGQVQDHLQAIYGIESELRASDFLVGLEVARRLGYTGRAPEELLVAEADGDLELALYVSSEVMARLGALEQEPPEHMLDAALESYCQLAEGVSHFLYLTHSARQGRRVSLLELEVQAEIDKFATCVLLCWRRGILWARELVRRLFEWISLRPGLSAQERWRYAQANRLSRRYCQRLLGLVREGRLEPLLAELRYSYRLGAQAKLSYLAAR